MKNRWLIMVSAVLFVFAACNFKYSDRRYFKRKFECEACGIDSIEVVGFSFEDIDTVKIIRYSRRPFYILYDSFFQYTKVNSKWKDAQDTKFIILDTPITIDYDFDLIINNNSYKFSDIQMGVRSNYRKGCDNCIVLAKKLNGEQWGSGTLQIRKSN